MTKGSSVQADRQIRKAMSVVVPAYNEEDIIGECLERLTGQLDFIREIVVVDNNSTDRTSAIVAEFAERFDEVVMLRENRQGLVYARNTGLDAAQGSLIARIDSDTLVPTGWAEQIVEFFLADTTHSWAAACGRGEAYGLPYGDTMEKLKTRLGIYRINSGKSETIREVPVLYGSNMVLRKATWAAVRDRVSMRRDVFEDVDTGLCVGENGGKIAFIPTITVGVSPRRMETGVLPFIEYMSFLPRTLLLHRRFGYAAAVSLTYVPWIVALHSARLVAIRGYDSGTEKFALRNFAVAGANRVNP